MNSGKSPQKYAFLMMKADRSSKDSEATLIYVKFIAPIVQGFAKVFSLNEKITVSVAKMKRVGKVAQKKGRGLSVKYFND